MVKAEFLNPSASVKDRAALYLIKDAEEKGLLEPGGTVVEGTAGNTGIGLAHMCLASGYKCVIYMPDTQSQEKIDMLRVLGADVRPVPAVAYDNPNNYNHQAKRYAESLDNAIWTNQFDNTANRRAHFETTGPEIWQQTEGTVDAITFSTGTGGTLAGSGMFLKTKNPGVKVIIADPPGSVLYEYFKSGKLERTGDDSITEGIGQGRVTENMKGAFEKGIIDDAVHVPDRDSVEMVFYLLHEEGFFVGASSGLNVAAAVQVANHLGPGHTITTCLCDTGQRYYARLFNREWLQEKGLLEAIPEKYRHALQ
ncbi:cysteine synthase 1-like [Paramuricea clavata]|nr:cysteine synthase 1-like [Paramuricea clavata]